MSGRKARAPRSNPIPPKAAPKAAKAPALEPGELRISESGRILWQQFQQRSAQEAQALLETFARDLRIPNGTPVNFNPERMTLTPAQPKTNAGRKPRGSGGEPAEG